MCLGKPKVPDPIRPPRETDAAIAADRERLKRSRQQGFAATNLTGGLGVTSTAPTAKATLLGGSS